MPIKENSHSWHLEVIPDEVADIAGRLAGIDVIRNFYLAGGTALALHLGHRRSVDLDFFSAQSFNEDVLIAAVQNLPSLSVLSKSPQTIYLELSGTKVSFIGYHYTLLFPLEHLRDIAVADVRDIACMKISALASRGSRRGFVDLYLVARQYGLPQLLDLFQRKFAGANYSMLHVRKALTYFVDAENRRCPTCWCRSPGAR